MQSVLELQVGSREQHVCFLAGMHVGCPSNPFRCIFAAFCFGADSLIMMSRICSCTPLHVLHSKCSKKPAQLAP